MSFLSSTGQLSGLAQAAAGLPSLPENISGILWEFLQRYIDIHPKPIYKMRSPSWAKLYWDERSDEPAWSWTIGDGQGVIEADTVFPDDVDDIYGAVEEVIRYCGLPCVVSDWAVDPVQDGGWAEWTDLT